MNLGIKAQSYRQAISFATISLFFILGACSSPGGSDGNNNGNGNNGNPRRDNNVNPPASTSCSGAANLTVIPDAQWSYLAGNYRGTITHEYERDPNTNQFYAQGFEVNLARFAKESAKCGYARFRSQGPLGNYDFTTELWLLPSLVVDDYNTTGNYIFRTPSVKVANDAQIQMLGTTKIALELRLDLQRSGSTYISPRFPLMSLMDCSLDNNCSFELTDVKVSGNLVKQ